MRQPPLVLKKQTGFIAMLSGLFSRKSNPQQQILESALDAIVTIDGNNKVTFFNTAAEKLWGYQRHEVLGQNVKMLVPQVIQSGHDEYVNSHRRTGHDKIVGKSRDVLLTRKNGSQVWVNLALSVTQLGGQAGYTAFVRDISSERTARETIAVYRRVRDSMPQTLKS